MEKKAFYLEEQTGADFTKDTEVDKHTYKLTFQTAEIKLLHSLEAEIIKEHDHMVERTIKEEEDELIITVSPKVPMMPFSQFRQKNRYAKLMIAHSLIEAVLHYHTPRLHLIVCPENLLVTDSLHVSFIHYGIKESLPPYEKDEDKLFLELRTTLAVLLDGEHRFSEYMNFTETMKLSTRTKQLIEAKTFHELQQCVAKWIKEEEEAEATSHSLPRQKWRLQKSLFIAFIALLIPATIYIIYALFFLHPRHEAFISSNEAFLNTNGSAVISELEPYNADQMPPVVQYQLAHSYIGNETLDRDQSNNVQTTLTLQSAEPYFHYWIAIGRGENEEADEIARNLQDDDLILYANLKWREEVREDADLSSDDREALLNQIQSTIDDYIAKIEEQTEQDESAENASAQPEEGDESEDRSDDETETSDGEENENPDEEEEDGDDE